MAFTNAEKQARWRERHIAARRSAQRIANLLVRRKWPDGTIKELAVLLGMFLTREGVRSLRRELRALKEPTKKERKAHEGANAQSIQAAWLRDHPDKTIKDYRRLSGDELWHFLAASNDAALLAEKQAWERDHPGEEWPEHMCGLSEREYTDYQRWRRQHERCMKQP